MKRDKRNAGNLEVQGRPTYFLDEKNLDKYFHDYGGDDSELKIKNTFTITNEGKIDFANMPISVRGTQEQLLVSEATIKPSVFAKFLFLKKKLEKGKNLIVFENKPLIDKLRSLNNLLDDIKNFPLISIDDEMISKQKDSLKKELPPSKYISEILMDKREAAFCFIGKTAFKVDYKSDSEVNLILPTETEFSLKVTLNGEDKITENGKSLFRNMNQSETPLHIFGSANIGEGSKDKIVLIIPVLIY